jgi:hypothetical protein
VVTEETPELMPVVCMGNSNEVAVPIPRADCALLPQLRREPLLSRAEKELAVGPVEIPLAPVTPEMRVGSLP